MPALIVAPMFAPAEERGLVGNPLAVAIGAFASVVSVSSAVITGADKAFPTDEAAAKDCLLKDGYYDADSGHCYTCPEGQTHIDPETFKCFSVLDASGNGPPPPEPETPPEPDTPAEKPKEGTEKILLGALAGAAVGALVGSQLKSDRTVVGGALGAFVGGVLGQWGRK